MAFSFLQQELAIDLGTANTVIFMNDKKVIDEPSIVAIDKLTGRCAAVGTKAKAMQGKENQNIKTIRPLKDGVIADFDASEQMIREFIKMIGNKRSIFSPSLRMVVCIPSGSTEVEKRAVRDAAEHSGGRDVQMIFEPMAAALGIGLDVTAPMGNMIVDIGGGTCEVAVISLAGIVYARSVRVGGDAMDACIVSYMRRVYNLMIGERTAEEIKITIGSAYPMGEEKRLEVKGRDLVAGLPKTLEVTSEEIRDALQDPVSSIVDAVRITLEKCPPELSADLVDRGLVLAGGGSMLRGLDKLIASQTGLPVTLSDDPLSAVAEGTGVVLNELNILAKSKLGH